MRQSLADDLRDFVEAGQLWDGDALNRFVGRLRAESETTGDPIPALLARPLTSLVTRLGMGAIDGRFADDIEGIIYPRLWKVMEGIWDGVPDGEMRTRIEVLNRRLARRFAEERPA